LSLRLKMIRGSLFEFHNKKKKIVDLNDRFFDVKMIDEEDFTLENIK
jgi:hypothetical protein